MDRRRFLKSAAGLFIPAAPALILPKLVRAQGGMGPGPGMVHSTGGGALGLQTSCTGFWEFENTSWLDASGSGTTLTAVGSPTSVAGIVGNAASTGNSANALTASSNANIVTAGGSFSVQAWINTAGAALGGAGEAFCKDANSFGNKEWGLGSAFSGTNKWAFQCFNTSTSNFLAVGAVTIASGWHHVVGTFNSSTGAMIVYVDGAASGGGATLTGTVQSSAGATLNVGRNGTTISTVNPLLVDQAGFWKGRLLSAGDVTLLYNSGAGLSWAAMV